MEFDKEKLEEIPINEVIEAFGGRYKMDNGPGGKQYNMHCCNGSVHKDNDKNPSLTIWTEVNICKCETGCPVKGNPIAVAKAMFNGEYKQACEYLHDTFNIPYKSGTNAKGYKTKKFAKSKPKEPEYLKFDKRKKFQKIKVGIWLKKYDKLSKSQKLKLVYTYLYRFSLTTDRDSLEKYYASRKITHTYVSKIGYLSISDVKKLVDELTHHFPIEDLVEFGILNDAKHKYYPLAWKKLKNAVLIPSFSLYSDLIEGLMFRPTDKVTNKWFTGKEMRLSIPSIIKPMPFGVGIKLLKSDCDIYITEGHIDAFSMPDDFCFIATPGVDAFEKVHLGLLRGKNIKIVFDQDDPGQQKAWGYYKITSKDLSMIVLKSKKDDVEGMLRIFESQKIEMKKYEVEGFRDELLKAGVKSVEIITWNKDLGKDINELLERGHDVQKTMRGAK